MLSLHNIRNQISIEVERRPPMLLVFDQQGCPSGKEFIHWLTNDEKDRFMKENEIASSFSSEK